MDHSPTFDEFVKLLLAAWTEALGRPARRDSDFVALGGTSLAAVSIATAVAIRYEQYDGIDVRALEALFASPTLGAMATALKAFTEEHACESDLLRATGLPTSGATQ